MAILSCVICCKTENIKKCAKCSTTPYCSRECQKADWKTHKKICARNAAERTTSSTNNNSSGSNSTRAKAKNLSVTVDKPFTRLEKGTWLHDRPKEDVFKLLVDTYRMRLEDDYKYDGDVTVGSVYDGSPNGLPAFRRFMKLVAKRPGLLPAWWDGERQRKECEAFGMRKEADGEECWGGLRTCMEKSDIMEYYGDSTMPMQLRMFGEDVYGSGPAGQSGAAMRQLMISGEQGGGANHVSLLDVSQSF